jgi:hypothetical protein
VYPVYSIQPYVIKFVSDLNQDGGFHNVTDLYEYLCFNTEVILSLWVVFIFSDYIYLYLDNKHDLYFTDTQSAVLWHTYLRH